MRARFMTHRVRLGSCENVPLRFDVCHSRVGYSDGMNTMQTIAEIERLERMFENGRHGVQRDGETGADSTGHVERGKRWKRRA
jgi:hypothetical protein